MRNKNQKQRGSTLLEYTAAAAVMIGLVWGAMSAMGTSVQTVFKSIQTWADSRNSEISAGNGGSGGGGAGE